MIDNDRRFLHSRPQEYNDVQWSMIVDSVGLIRQIAWPYMTKKTHVLAPWLCSGSQRQPEHIPVSQHASNIFQSRQFVVGNLYKMTLGKLTAASTSLEQSTHNKPSFHKPYSRIFMNILEISWDKMRKARKAILFSTCLLWSCLVANFWTCTVHICSPLSYCTLVQ